MATGTKKKTKLPTSVLKKSSVPLCAFCHQSEGNAYELGQFHALEDVSVHYFCILFSSALEQNGEDDEGILGFLMSDIKKELSRGVKLKCSYCGLSGATIGCTNKGCRKTYHYPCGLKNCVQFIFTGNFSTYCTQHRKYQKGERKGELVECQICYENTIADAQHAVCTPCCQKSSWFHSICMKKLAINAGYFFKCPLCNDKKIFKTEMLNQGIYIPEQDASWELEPNAYQELLERPIYCEAPDCRCPAGRKNDKVGTRWEIILCHCCGSTGIHLACEGLPLRSDKWVCPVCSQILNGTKSVKTGASVHCQSNMPSPKRQKINDEISLPGSSLKNELHENQFVDVCNLSDDDFAVSSQPISDNTLMSHYKNKRSACMPSLIADLILYAQSLPEKLVSFKFDSVTFLHTLNTMVVDRDDVYHIDIHCYDKFIECDFNFVQMSSLRKIFEMVFIITSLKKKRNKDKIAGKNNPFIHSTSKKHRTYIRKQITSCQSGLATLLRRAKEADLLEENNTWFHKEPKKIKPMQLSNDGESSSSNVLAENSKGNTVSSDFLTEGWGTCIRHLLQWCQSYFT